MSAFRNQSRKRILLFGSTGYVGQSLYTMLSNDHEVLRASSGSGFDVHCDLSQADMSDLDLLDGPLDGVVFAQGLNPSKSFYELSADDFLRMLHVNVVGPMLACRALQPRLASDASVVFFSSVATGKGSYDPSYAAAKSALEGLMHSLANVMPNQRFNIIRLGLVEGSPVHLGMTEDFVTKHKQRMRNGHLVAVAKVASMTKEVLLNACLNRAVIQLDGGYL